MEYPHLSQVNYKKSLGCIRSQTVAIQDNEVIKIGILSSLSRVLNSIPSSVKNEAQKDLTKLVNNVAKLLAIISEEVSTTIKSISPDDVSSKDMEYMIQEALMDIVPPAFEGTMIGLRVVYTLDSQLYGLAQTLGDYIYIDPSEVIEQGVTGSIDDVQSAVYDEVQSQIDNISDKEGLCKNFWNNKDLSEFL